MRTTVILAILGVLGAATGFILDPTQPPFIWSWNDCAGHDAAVSLTQLDISPKPAVVPGNLTVEVQGTVHRHIGADTQMTVTIEKELLGKWTSVPCQHNLGSCHYDNPCEFLQAFGNGGQCPPALAQHGLPCACPFSPDKLAMPPSIFEITHIPADLSWVVDGNYRVHAEMKQNNHIVGCFNVQLTINLKQACTGIFCPSGKK